MRDAKRIVENNNGRAATVARRNVSGAHDGPSGLKNETMATIRATQIESRIRIAMAIGRGQNIRISVPITGSPYIRNSFMYFQPTSRFRGPDTLWRVPWNRLLGFHVISKKDDTVCGFGVRTIVLNLVVKP